MKTGCFSQAMVGSATHYSAVSFRLLLFSGPELKDWERRLTCDTRQYATSSTIFVYAGYRVAHGIARAFSISVTCHCMMQ